MSGDWRERASCAGVDPELWFPLGDSAAAVIDGEIAKRICRECPVALACLEDAIAMEGGSGASNRYGIRGGRDGAQRHGIWKRRAASARTRKQDAA